MSERPKKTWSQRLQRVGEIMSTGGYVLLERKSQPTPASQEEIDGRFARVKELTELCHERFEEEVTTEWLLDHNLPDLYAEIGRLYLALGEPERLQQAANEAKQHPQTS